jgi:hypothetical protein
MRVSQKQDVPILRANAAEEQKTEDGGQIEKPRMNTESTDQRQKTEEEPHDQRRRKHDKDKR